MKRNKSRKEIRGEKEKFHLMRKNEERRSMIVDDEETNVKNIEAIDDNFSSMKYD